MGIIGKEIDVDISPRPEMGAKRIVKILTNQIKQIDSNLQQIRSVVRKHGKSNITSELEGDASELLSLYNDLKSIVETYTDMTIDDIPD